MSDPKDDEYSIIDGAFFFVDIVGLSHPRHYTKEQVNKIITLNKIVQQILNDMGKNPSTNSDDVMILPTGDGMVVVFKNGKDLDKPLELAKSLHNALKTNTVTPKLEVRIGLNRGPVYQIPDILGKNNFWGPGIIYARRIMDIGDSWHILATDSYWKDIHSLDKKYDVFKHIGKGPIKHESKIDVYSLYDGNVGNSELPISMNPDFDVFKKKREFFFSKVKFKSLDIEIILRNPSTSEITIITRSSFTNISTENLDEYPRYMECITPTTMDDLKIKTTDGDGNELVIEKYLDNPLMKCIGIKMEDLKPGKNATVVVEWTWKDPEKFYGHTNYAECDEFSMKFNYPDTYKQKINFERRINPIESKFVKLNDKPKKTQQNGRIEKKWIIDKVVPNTSYRIKWC